MINSYENDLFVDFKIPTHPSTKRVNDTHKPSVRRWNSDTLYFHKPSPFTLKNHQQEEDKENHSNNFNYNLNNQPPTDEMDTTPVTANDSTHDYVALRTSAPLEKPKPKLRLRARRYSSVENVKISTSILPLATASQPDLKCISSQTCVDLLDGRYSNHYDSVIMLDCRFDYEFTGGHMRGSFNYQTQNSVEETFFKTEQLLKMGSKLCLIFYCEFSSHRAPSMMRFVREWDRTIHAQCYPQLYYPEIYLLNGGYCQFYNEFPQYCDPCSYLPMKDGRFSEQCKLGMSTIKKNPTSRSFSAGNLMSLRRLDF